ncbi:Gar1/Naf1 RNA binding region-domain containing protein [Rhodotorula toruloides]|uniref:H/ACA ribonucleoprotein complex subunit n=1 Tax=Rhodotorula toruloides TaxID=5286 RepID=A0A2S9ZW54_RHOTO|nr:Gar1/Naf1 RNA binding region-domain containing protein [Rhodotorula toruloides]
MTRSRWKARRSSGDGKSCCRLRRRCGRRACRGEQRYRKKMLLQGRKNRRTSAAMSRSRRRIRWQTSAYLWLVWLHLTQLILSRSLSSDSSDSDSDSSSSESDSTTGAPQGGRRNRRNRQRAASVASDIDDDESGIVSSKTAPKTEHEVVEPDVAPPAVQKLDENAEIAKFGKVESVIENVVVVKAETGGDWRVLDEGTVVCWEDKTVIGTIFETFGSVQQPFYSIRFPSSAPPDRTVFTISRPVFYSPNLASFVFTRDLRHIKGSDASNIWDEERISSRATSRLLRRHRRRAFVRDDSFASSYRSDGSATTSSHGRREAAAWASGSTNV